MHIEELEICKEKLYIIVVNKKMYEEVSNCFRVCSNNSRYIFI